MQRGDLADGTLAELLQTLSTAQVTGALHIRAALAAIRVPIDHLQTPPGADLTAELEADQAVVYLRDGQVYSARAPGPRPLLGTRLVTEGIITRQALAEALETQAGALSGWRLGELLVHLGYVEPEAVAGFVHEQTVDAVTRIRSWPAGDWQLRRGERTREASGDSLDVGTLLEEIAQRERTTALLIDMVGTVSDVLVANPPDTVELDLLSTALLGAIDGQHNLGQIAITCGLTIYEASCRISPMAEAGWVRVSAPLRDANALVSAGSPFGSSASFGSSAFGPGVFGAAPAFGPAPALGPATTFGPAPAFGSAGAGGHQPAEPDPAAAELAQLQDRSRAAAAAELAATHAETEAQHRAELERELEASQAGQFEAGHLETTEFAALQLAAAYAEPEAELPYTEPIAIDPPAADADELAWLGTMAREVEEARFAAETRLHADSAREAGIAGELDSGEQLTEPAIELAPMLAADHRAALAAALSEVAASSPSTAPAPAADPLPPAPETNGMLEPRPEWTGRPVNDTASLLRELASLGLDDEPRAEHPGPSPRAPVRPAVRQPPAGKKPRKGLFGR